MPLERIKIGHQRQADMPIFLTKSGTIVCGDFEYRGVKVRTFKGVFDAISSKVDHPRRDHELDVSTFHHWNAMQIYDQYIARPWKKSISARKMERLAVETDVFLMLESLRSEFKRSVGAKWRKIYKASKSDDPNRPTQGWHLFGKPKGL